MRWIKRLRKAAKAMKQIEALVELWPTAQAHLLSAAENDPVLTELYARIRDLSRLFHRKK